MARCSACGQRVAGDREKVGARCPECRAPLYEEARDPHVLATFGQVGYGAMCAHHPTNGAVAACRRCGNFVCCVCWTRWEARPTCMTCVNRILAAKDTTPSEERAHFRQAILAIVFGVTAWLITLFAVILMALGAGKNFNEVLVGFGVLIMMVTPFPAVLGVGQGAAAIRSRGNHMILATIGLILSGVHTGIVIGLFTFTVWDSSR